MPRKLPWATPTKNIASPRNEATSRGTPRQRVVDGRGQQGSAGRGRVTSIRSPSSSPPPARPPVEFMRDDGQDDAWIMVEDEFMSTANEYTRHLHYTAYKERKKQIAQGVSNNIFSGHASNKRETEPRRDNAVHPGADMDDKGEEGDDLIIGDRRLAELMFGHGGPKDRNRTLLNATSNMDATDLQSRANPRSQQSMTRAKGRANLMKEDDSETEDSAGDDGDEDDLNAIVQGSRSILSPSLDMLSSSPAPAQTGVSSARDVTLPETGPNRNTLTRPTKRAKQSSSPSNLDRAQPKGDKPKDCDDGEDDDDDDTKTHRRAGRITTSLAAYRARRARRAEEHRDATDAELPLFLS